MAGVWRGMFLFSPARVLQLRLCVENGWVTDTLCILCRVRLLLEAGLVGVGWGAGRREGIHPFVAHYS